jgi:DNA-binding response OmpR family regulator
MKSKYTQLVLDVIAKSPSRCLKREVIISEVSRITNEPKERVENALVQLLRRMVSKGLLERRDGYYCLKS